MVMNGRGDEVVGSFMYGVNVEVLGSQRSNGMATPLHPLLTNSCNTSSTQCVISTGN